MATATNNAECTLKPSDITKIERIAQLKEELKRLEAEIKPKLKMQPIGTFKVGARMVKLDERFRVSVKYGKMIEHHLGKDWIEDHKEGFTSESCWVEAKLLGRA